MKKSGKRIAATAAAVMMMFSGSAIGASAANVNATLETTNNVLYKGSISAKNKSYSVVKCKNKNVEYKNNIVPSHPKVKYTLKGSNTLNTVTVSKNNDNKLAYYFYTEIQTYNIKTKKTSTSKRSITTKDAGCGMSLKRDSDNKSLRYTLMIDVSRTGDVDPITSRTLRLVVNQK
ncbi:MAG: hypothetical protein K2F81_09315 [Ruminococcus sp.]|nr:hypothetical protein [Ruminococcus sp.]